MHREWLLAADRPADRLLVESFVMLDHVGVNQAGIVPFWTAFPVRDALHAVREYLRQRRYDEIECPGSRTPSRTRTPSVSPGSCSAFERPPRAGIFRT